MRAAMLSGPKDEDSSFYKIISLSKEVENFEFSLQYNIEIGLIPEDVALVAKYNHKIIYLAVATKSAKGKIIQYSQSFSKISN